MSDDDIINDVLHFFYNGGRECSFSDLKMIPQSRQTIIRDKLLIEGLIEKTLRQYNSFGDNYSLTNKAIQLIISHQSYQNYLKNKNSEKTKPNFINVNASNSSIVNISTGNNNSMNQSISINEKIYEDLKELGLSGSQIDDLKEIVNREIEEKQPIEKKRKKILGWFASLATDLLKKGIEDKIPTMISYLEKIITQ